MILTFSIAFPVIGQDAVPESNSLVNANSSASPKPTPVPFSEIVAQTESALTTLKQMDASLMGAPGAQIVERDLPPVLNEIDLSPDETAE